MARLKRCCATLLQGQQHPADVQLTPAGVREGNAHQQAEWMSATLPGAATILRWAGHG